MQPVKLPHAAGGNAIGVGAAGRHDRHAAGQKGVGLLIQAEEALPVHGNQQQILPAAGGAGNAVSIVDPVPARRAQAGGRLLHGQGKDVRREAHPAEIPVGRVHRRSLPYQKTAVSYLERILFNYTSFHLLVNGVC